VRYKEGLKFCAFQKSSFLNYGTSIAKVGAFVYKKTPEYLSGVF